MEHAIQPECHKRHAEIEIHISQGRFWRGTIVTFIVAFIGIAVAQFNIANENSKKMIEANAKLTQMVEINTKRLTCLEDIHPRVSSDKKISI